MKPDHEIAELYSDLETNCPAMQISDLWGEQSCLCEVNLSFSA